MSWEAVVVPIVAALAAYLFGQGQERSRHAREDLTRWKTSRFEVYRDLWAVAGEWEALAMELTSRGTPNPWPEEDRVRIRDLDRRLVTAIQTARLVVGSWDGNEALNPFRSSLLQMLPPGHGLHPPWIAPGSDYGILLRFHQRNELVLAPLAIPLRAPDRRWPPKWLAMRRWTRRLSRYG